MRTSRVLLWILLAIEIAFTCWLFFAHRIPKGHDAFQFFSLQYWFLSQSSTAGEIPQWMPNLTHGTVSTWWYSVQGGLLQNALLFAGRFVPGSNFLAYFHLGMLVDQLVLVLGCWLLAMRLYRSPLAAFVVTACAVAPAVWIDQPWYNFRFFYAVPLILYLVHRFIDTRHWRWAAAAGNLLALQTIGNLPYFIPMTSLMVFVYVVAYLGVNRDEARPLLRRQVWNWRCVPAGISILISFYIAYLAISVGVDEIISYNFGRSPDGRVSLDGFISFAGNQGLQRWAEMPLGVSCALDYTLYIGILPLALLLIGLFQLPRNRWHLVITAGALLLLATGTYFAQLIYHVWPGAQYYRHLALLTPLVRLMLCFVVGQGVLWLFDPGKNIARDLRLLVVGGMAVLLVILAVYVNNAIKGIYVWRPFNDWRLAANDLALHLDSLRLVFARTLLFCTASLAVVMLRLRGRISTKTLVPIYLAIVLLDVNSFRAIYLWHQSQVVSESDRDLMKMGSAAAFPERRTIRHDQSDPRVQFYRKMIAEGKGSRYWSIDAFVGAHSVDSGLRTDHWLWPFDRLRESLSGQRIDVFTGPPRGYAKYQILDFPSDGDVARKLTGVSEPLIQFFSRAFSFDDDHVIGNLLVDPRFHGDALLLSGGQGTRAEPSAATLGSDRLAIPYTVTGYSANRVEVRVNNTQSQPVWMFYGDVWHPGWNAAIDGKPASFERAMLAYKAVPVPPGEHLVEWRFNQPKLFWARWGIGLNSVAWLIGLLVTFGVLARRNFEPVRQYE